MDFPSLPKKDLRNGEEFHFQESFGWEGKLGDEEISWEGSGSMAGGSGKGSEGGEGGELGDSETKVSVAGESLVRILKNQRSE